MAFRVANLPALVKFNSSTSCKFLESYEGFVRDKIATERIEPSHKTFAPSSFRCKRKQWFRLRGAQPETIVNPDTVLQFTAEVGTARHRVIQQNLKDMLGDDWVDVGEYLKSVDCKFPYNLTPSEDSLETLIEFIDPPVRFAVDGIVRIDGKYYLLEIKTCDHGSFQELTDPKEVHVDQVKCYCALLGIYDVLMIYEDRQYGEMKCYQIRYNAVDHKSILDQMSEVQQMAKTNLAPARLPKGDYVCSNCEYKKKCNEWG